MVHSTDWVDESTRRTYIKLTSLPRFDARKWQAMQRCAGVSATQLHNLSNAQLKALGFNAEQCDILLGLKDQHNVEKALQWHQPEKRQWVITPEDSCYPELLSHITTAPLALFVKGNIELLKKPKISIVGSRKPTHYGKRIAFEFAQNLNQYGVCVVSGLALGIDAQAHKGSLGGQGNTIAVLGCGIDVCYPHRNRALFTDIVELGGLLLSEFAPGTAPHKGYFPRRNRIVSGLTFGVLVVEAAVKSGSLITARLALEQNREVFAVPGNINSPQSDGCHFLIQQGAKLTTSVSDILDEIQVLSLLSDHTAIETREKSPISLLATPDLLDSVEFDVTPIDIITERSKLPVQEVMAALLEYELRGLVASTPGGYVKLRGK
ncbi:DNA-processing protein DprA [Alteromonas facilis]|uniref:DNA-processing protein DprA n=1 Tax=Alteromonas facilis TaxID=2048004 RepID=UPI000C28BCEC|nr:DNA-processing protein DprA [Alteromonas facilis]